MDDSDLDLLSTLLVALSVVCGLLAVLFYRRNPQPSPYWWGMELFRWRTKSDIQWTGKGFEPGRVADRVARVRRDYVGALHSRPHRQFHSRALLSAATRMVRACSYWQHASLTETTENLSSKGPPAEVGRV